MILSVGIARKNISPPPGIYLIGYGDRTKGNQGVHDDLTATALVMEAGLQRVVMVTCDLLAINEFTVKRIQAQAGSNLVICCSHTHSGPITYADSHSPKKNQAYVNYLINQVVSAVKDAQANLQPARLTWAQGEADIAVNRRQRMPDGHIEIGTNPGGPVDHGLSLVQVQTLEGKPMVNLVNFQCHGTVLGPKNLLVSADWIGAMRQKVERESGTPVMYVQGATGDLNPQENVRDADYSAVEATGLRIADRVLELIPQLEPISSQGISFHQQQVWLQLEAEAHDPSPPPIYRSVLARVAHVPRFLVDFVLNQRYPWKTHIAARDGFWSVPVVLTHIRAGDLAIYALGAEVFTEIGLQIKHASPTSHTLFASVSSGCIGYLPTRAEHALGGYEVDMSPYFYRMPGRLKADSAERVINTIKEISEG
jgi:hypothetical protein